jgi:hypothetical protein
MVREPLLIPTMMELNEARLQGRNDATLSSNRNVRSHPVALGGRFGVSLRGALVRPWGSPPLSHSRMTKGLSRNRSDGS